MSANRPSGEFPSSRKEFLAELDGMLKEPLELHCIGGFVLTFFYGMLRTTGDIDCFTAVPPNRKGPAPLGPRASFFTSGNRDALAVAQEVV